MPETTYEKLEWIHFAIQEAVRGNIEELEQALEFVEDIRESYMTTATEEMAKRLEKAGLLIPLLEPERAVELAIKCMKGGENNERSRD